MNDFLPASNVLTREHAATAGDLNLLLYDPS